MADWKQITARIRRARSGKDPAGQLANLYEKTSDAMVAFELAKLFESSGQNSDAAKWYSTAATRFRRAEWKTKAREAAVRLGGGGGETSAPGVLESDEQFHLTPAPSDSEEKQLPLEQNPEALESPVADTSEVQEAAPHEASAAPQTERKHRRRGRRGGQNRRRAQPANGAAGQVAKYPAKTQEAPETAAAGAQPQEPDAPASPGMAPGHAIPALPMEPLGEIAGPSLKGRYGDPGLSSRLSLLEMQFRRLLACPPAKLSEADRAPAGPGVIVLTDSDLTSYYYVEVCQTLRIAVSNLLRGGTRRGTDSLKRRLAEHLGIPETRVAKYLADHCVVRWLQLDEGASHFAHFAIAVLRPILNE
jgi:hypothetical protein